MEQIAAEEAEPRFSVVMTSDAFPDPEDAFAIWDNQTNDYYTASDGTVRTFSREEAEEQFLAGLEPQEIKADRQEEPAQETAGAIPVAEEPGTLPATRWHRLMA